MKENRPTAVLTYFPIVNYKGFVTNAAKTFGYTATRLPCHLEACPVTEPVETRGKAAPKLDLEFEHLQSVEQILMRSEPSNYSAPSCC